MSRRRLTTRQAREIRAGILLARDTWGTARIIHGLADDLLGRAYARTRHADPRERATLPKLPWYLDWHTVSHPALGLTVTLLQQATSAPWVWSVREEVTFPLGTTRKTIERAAAAMSARAHPGATR